MNNLNDHSPAISAFTIILMDDFSLLDKKEQDRTKMFDDIYANLCEIVTNCQIVDVDHLPGCSSITKRKIVECSDILYQNCFHITHILCGYQDDAVCVDAVDRMVQEVGEFLKNILLPTK